MISMKKSFFIAISLIILAIVIGILYVFLQPAPSSEKQKTYKIGVIVRGNSYKPAVEGFKKRMTEMGYVEGGSVTYDIQYVVNAADIASTTSAVIAGKPDAILTFSTPVTTEASKQTKTIPIIFGSMGDPLASGLVDTLRHPGRNVTGIMSLSVDLSPKRLDLLKQLFPSLKKVAVPVTMTDIAGKNSLDLIDEIAPKLGVTIVPYVVDAKHTPADVALTISKEDVDGIVLSADSATWAALPAFVDQAKKEKIPFAVFDRDMVDKGGLVGYGPDYAVVGQQAANFIKKVLSGISPADLPVESPEKLLLALNLKTAQELGLVVPDLFLSKVDYLVR